MNSEPPAELHAAHIDQLRQEWDWSGLVRYGIGHQVSDALQEAAFFASERKGDMSEGGGWYKKELLLRDAFESLSDVNAALPSSLTDDPEWIDDLDIDEKLVVHLVRLYPRALRCEAATAADPLQQENLVRDGLAAASEACNVSRALGDKVTEAFFLTLGALGHCALDESDAAKEKCRCAITMYKELETDNPALFADTKRRALRIMSMIDSGDKRASQFFQKKRKQDFLKGMLYHFWPTNLVLLLLLICRVIKREPGQLYYWLLGLSFLLSAWLHARWNIKQKERQKRTFQERLSTKGPEE